MAQYLKIETLGGIGYILAILEVQVPSTTKHHPLVGSLRFACRALILGTYNKLVLVISGTLGALVLAVRSSAAQAAVRAGAMRSTLPAPAVSTFSLSCSQKQV